MRSIADSVDSQPELPVVARDGPATISRADLGPNLLNRGNRGKCLVSTARGEAAITTIHREAQLRRLRLPDGHHFHFPHSHDRLLLSRLGEENSRDNKGRDEPGDESAFPINFPGRCRARIENCGVS
jgi:hypothetical protein